MTFWRTLTHNKWHFDIQWISKLTDSHSAKVVDQTWKICDIQHVLTKSYKFTLRIIGLQSEWNGSLPCRISIIFTRFHEVIYQGWKWSACREYIQYHKCSQYFQDCQHFHNHWVDTKQITSIHETWHTGELFPAFSSDFGEKWGKCSTQLRRALREFFWNRLLARNIPNSIYFQPILLNGVEHQMHSWLNRRETGAETFSPLWNSELFPILLRLSAFQRLICEMKWDRR
jgi:hypothetical protein